MEGSAVVIRPRRPRWPVLRHPPEVLSRALPPLVVVGAEFIRTSSFGVQISVVIGPVAPVVPVVAVLLIRPLAWGAVVAVTPRAAVHVSVWTSVTVVIFVAVLVVLMMPVPLPRLVAVTGVIVFAVPLPVASIIISKVPLIARNVRFSVVPV